MPLVTPSIPARVMAMVGILYTLLPAQNLQISLRKAGDREHFDVPSGAPPFQGVPGEFPEDLTEYYWIPGRCFRISAICKLSCRM